MVQFDVTTFAKGNEKQIISYLNQYANEILAEKKLLIDKLPFNIFLIGLLLNYSQSKVILMNRDLGLILSHYLKSLY